MTGVKEMAIAASAVSRTSPPRTWQPSSAGPACCSSMSESPQTAHGVIPGAVLVPRGMLEFHADSTITSHLDGFDPGRRVILYCAAGGRPRCRSSGTATWPISTAASQHGFAMAGPWRHRPAARGPTGATS
jgi:hypothetical protein